MRLRCARSQPEKAPSKSTLFASAMRWSSPPTRSAPLSAYAHPTQCPALTPHVRLPVPLCLSSPPGLSLLCPPSSRGWLAMQCLARSGRARGRGQGTEPHEWVRGGSKRGL
eukprot:3934060-Rhodomonas_salina.6